MNLTRSLIDVAAKPRSREAEESAFFSFKIPILSPKILSWLLTAKRSRDVLV